MMVIISLFTRTRPWPATADATTGVTNSGKGGPRTWLPLGLGFNKRECICLSLSYLHLVSWPWPALMANARDPRLQRCHEPSLARMPSVWARPQPHRGLHPFVWVGSKRDMGRGLAHLQLRPLLQLRSLPSGNRHRRHKSDKTRLKSDYGYPNGFEQKKKGKRGRKEKKERRKKELTFDFLTC